MSESIESKILEGYKNYVLEEGRDPASVYQFARHLSTEEKEFYDHFASLEQVRSSFWMRRMEENFARLEEDETYRSYSAREQWLAFLFDFFEGLKEERSFFLLFWPKSMHWSDFSAVKGMKKFYLQHTRDWLERALDEDPVMVEWPLGDDILEEVTWLHFVFLIHFWVKDTSKGFERTDGAIEKSVHLFFELMENRIKDQLLDFFKFLAPDWDSPLDMLDRIKRAFR